MLVGSVVILPAGPVLAQGYPTRSLTIVVPSAAGIGPDLWARVLAEKMSPRLGQPVIVENKAGVGGLLGAAQVAKSEPDGHTLLVTTNAMASAPHVLPKDGIAGNFDPIRDLTPISLLGTTGTLLIVNKALGIKTVAELVALATKRTLSCGSTSVGSSLHLACVMFRKAVGRDMTLVPYRSVAQLFTDTTAGRVDMMFMGYSSIAPHLKPDGAFAAVAVASRERSALAPDLPTLSELGYPEMVLGAWYGIYAPAATQKPIVAQLNQLVDSILQMPDVRQLALQQKLEIVGGPPSVMAQVFEGDFTRFRQVVQEAGIQATE
jgi:tripartite-type tricarboxylate transporter receptor subunit TctC